MKHDRKNLAYCIVWTPLPLITWLIPFIGHTGICDSEGKVHDFSGDYSISYDDMAFSEPHKYIQMNPNETEQANWDRAIQRADHKFTYLEHNLFTNNCHSHVAEALNELNYKSSTSYNMISIWWYFIIYGKYISLSHIVRTYIGFFMISVLVIYFKYFK